MTSTRIRGKKLALTLGSPGIEVWQDVQTYTLVSEELDGPTYGDIASGAAQYRLTGTAIQSFDATSFWDYVWENAGSDVAFTLAPHGNEIPTSIQPHFAGTLNLGRSPQIGGDVSTTHTFEFDFEVIGQPVKIIEVEG